MRFGKLLQAFEVVGVDGGAGLDFDGVHARRFGDQQIDFVASGAGRGKSTAADCVTSCQV